MPRCLECDALERRYRGIIRQIDDVVDGRFPSVAEKIEALHKYQDLRDEVMKALYEHKRTHRRRRTAKSASHDARQAA
jgi:hypothetical protein